MKRSVAIVGAGALALATVIGAFVVYGAKDKRAESPVVKRPSAAPTRPEVAMELPPVQILVRKALQPGGVAYRYRVINGSAFPITSVLIGYEYFHGQPELLMLDYEVPPGAPTSPNAWTFEMQPTEEDSLGNIAWVASDPNGGIAGGQELVGFSIRLAAEESAYESGHWTVYLNSGEQIYYSGALAAETGQVAVPPSSVHAATGVRVKPNPAGGSVDISFQIPTAGASSVKVFDVRGRIVKEILSGALDEGEATATWDGTDRQGVKVSAGTYFLRIKTPTTERFARITWIR